MPLHVISEQILLMTFFFFHVNRNKKQNITENDWGLVLILSNRLFNVSIWISLLLGGKSVLGI